MTAQFKHILLMVNDIFASTQFYNQGLGLRVRYSKPGWAELDANGTILVLHAAHEKAQGGDSPILSFLVDDIYMAVITLGKMGAKLETRIIENSGGMVAAMRTPDGHRLSLLQPAAVSAA